VKQQFYKGWKHPHKRKPRIKVIFRIISPPSFHIPYYQHRDLSESSRCTVTSPNERFLFHGTSRACSLGEDRSTIHLCMLPECHLCCIVRNSFDIRKCGTKNKFQRRFGTGIYTTSVSSKADDYTQNIDQEAATRVLLLNRVIVGKPNRRIHNAVNLTAPPPGCHSVIGEPGAGLNYEETVVYNDDAIRPAFLIVYVEKPKLKLRTVIKMLLNTPMAM
ncbi:Tankyrase-1, partial [Leucoagaricus sp. SymC.cos]